MNEQATTRKQTRRPHTRLELEKIRNQALLREDAKRKARAISTMTGLITGQDSPKTGQASDKPRGKKEIAPKKSGEPQPVIYRPDARPVAVAVVAQPKFVTRVPDSLDNWPDSNIRELTAAVELFRRS